RNPDRPAVPPQGQGHERAAHRRARRHVCRDRGRDPRQSQQEAERAAPAVPGRGQAARLFIAGSGQLLPEGEGVLREGRGVGASSPDSHPRPLFSPVAIHPSLHPCADRCLQGGAMFEGYRVVAVTPAGRRRYMELLVPQILASNLVDRYDIWVNTADPADIAFFEGLAAKYDRVRLVPQPDGKAPGVPAIHGFHRLAMDVDTIYVRFDDDIVWLEPGFFEALLRFRVDHPHYFLVMP